MERGHAGAGAGPYARQRLAKSLASAALSGTGVVKALPLVYRLELLARRWNVAPYELEAALDDPLVQRWVQRGLVFMSLEAVEVKHG